MGTGGHGLARTDTDRNRETNGAPGDSPGAPIFLSVSVRAGPRLGQLYPSAGFGLFAESLAFRARAELVEGFTGEGKRIAQDTVRLLQALTTTAERLSTLVTKLDQTVASLNNDRGTVGMLLNDNRLYEELLLSARRLTKMLDEFRDVAELAKKGQLRIRAF